MIKSCTTLPPLNTSDHSAIAVTLVSKSFPPTSKYCARTVWHYRDADFAAANELLTDVPWDELIDHEDIETSWNNWKSTFLEIMSLCIPSMKLKAHKRLPWLTKPLLVEIEKRDALYRRARKTGRRSVWDLYNKQRNKIITLLRTAKSTYFLGLKAANSKKFWSTVRSLNKSAPSIPTLEHGSVTATTDKEKAELLNYVLQNGRSLKLQQYLK